MPAQIVDLATWKADHSPATRLWNAQCRVVSAWWKLLFRFAAMSQPSHSRRESQ